MPLAQYPIRYWWSQRVMVALRELIKNKKLVRQISLACILVGACEAHAQDSKLSVDNPFATQLTHDNMSKCDDSYSQYYSALLRITSYSYVFLPPDEAQGSGTGLMSKRQE